MTDRVPDPTFARIREEAAAALASAKSGDDASRRGLGAVNWADLRVVEVLRCEDEDGRVTWQVLVEEAAPDSGIAGHVHGAVTRALPDIALDVRAEW